MLISDRRNRLGDGIIECLESWVQQGLIFGATESDKGIIVMSFIYLL